MRAISRFSSLLMPLALAFSISFPAAHANQEKPPSVVASIIPVQLIASDLLDGIVEPKVLLPAGASPHQYSLKPSDARMLTNADVVIWIGPELERFLVKPLSQTSALTIKLLTEEMIHSGEEDVDEHEHEHEHHHEEGHHEEEHYDEEGDGHDHGGVDPHIWLDPHHALAIADAIHAALVQHFPHLKALLDQNLDRFTASLIQQDRALMSAFAPLSDRGFLVFHDAYGRFIEHYNLMQLGSVTINPSRKPGAKHLGELRDTVESSQAVCVFSEPQFSSAVVASIVAGTGAKVSEVDPLGQNVVLGAGAYQRFLADFAQPFYTCLAP
ncbi:zinc ABC transporter substrate-binding protein ZnuA [Neptunomonas phycophila]|uniref:zinc ABC transporter substrate-binding protein ZnuA n=1 Tax=Neptunomonas phycophila TaxID=1572645 RepID=UPI0015B93D93|nr:zinc ABC transporter substrate-binding protein ZnuA [Neptunomonas phycophila]